VALDDSLTQPPPLQAPPRPRRAALLTAVAVGCGALTALYVARNLFLAPAFGIACVVAAILAMRAGAPRWLLVVVVLFVAIPLLFALLALLFLALNNPAHMKLNGISWVSD
jgi:hypothetical protein